MLFFPSFLKTNQKGRKVDQNPKYGKNFSSVLRLNDAQREGYTHHHTHTHTQREREREEFARDNTHTYLFFFS